MNRNEATSIVLAEAFAENGKYAGPPYAYELIKDARERFPDATIDIYLNEETLPIVKVLVENGLIEIVEIDLSPKTRVSRIENMS